MIGFFKRGWIGGVIFLIYFLLYFYIVPLDVTCNYHSTSNYCVGFIEKNTLPEFLPTWLLPIDLGFFYPVHWTLNYLNTHLTPIDPNDTALIVLLGSAIFYLVGNIVGNLFSKKQKALA
jgi:hypothetical protein